MTPFRGSIFRDVQTQEFSSARDFAPPRFVDEHNPPGSMFRAEQTYEIYRARARYESLMLQPSAARLEPEPVTFAQPAPTPAAVNTTQLEPNPPDTRRHALMAANRLIRQASEMVDDDARGDLKPYVREIKISLARFERSIKPKSPIRALFDQLFED